MYNLLLLLAARPRTIGVSLNLALKKKQESRSLKQKSFELLLAYRTTPHSNIRCTPAKLLLAWPSNMHQVHVTKPDIGEKVGRSIKNEKYNMTGEQ